MQNTPGITIDTPITFRDELPESVDVVIIGGGVIGVFAALYLTRMGKRVFLCEKGRIAANNLRATGVGYANKAAMQPSFRL